MRKTTSGAVAFTASIIALVLPASWFLVEPTLVRKERARFIAEHKAQAAYAAEHNVNLNDAVPRFPATRAMGFLFLFFCLVGPSIAALIGVSFGCETLISPQPQKGQKVLAIIGVVVSIGVILSMLGTVLYGTGRF